MGVGGVEIVDNDVMLGAINDSCANARGSISETVRLALRSPAAAAASGKPLHRRNLYLPKLNGTLLTLLAKSATAPVAECEFVGYSDDMAGLADRLLKIFDLPAPTVRETDSWRVTQRSGQKGRPKSVELQYGLQDNQKVGAFNLRIKR